MLCTKNIFKSFAPLLKTTTRNLSQQPSVLQEYRRLNQRVFVKPPVDDNPEYFEFPDRRVGTDIDLNHALHKHGIAPKEDAYRNLYLRALLERTPKIDKITKAAIFDLVEQPSNIQTNFVTKASPYAKQKSLLKSVRMHFCNSLVFVHDGALGSNANIRVRIISDDPKIQFFSHNMIVPYPLGEPDNFNVELLVYVATKLPSENTFSFYSRDERILAIGGTSSLQVLQKSLTDVAFDVLGNTESNLLLNCDSTLHRNNSLSLVFSGDFFLRNKTNANNISGAHGNVWNASGISPLFNGIRQPQNKMSGRKGDMIEIGKEARFITSKTNANENKDIVNQQVSCYKPHPSNVVYLVSDSNLPPISEISNQQSQLLLLSGAKNGKPFFSGLFHSPEDVAASVMSRYAKFLEQHQVRSFVANTTNLKKPFSGEDFEAFFANPKNVPKNPKEIEPLLKGANDIVKQIYPKIQI